MAEIEATGYSGGEVRCTGCGALLTFTPPLLDSRFRGGRDPHSSGPRIQAFAAEHLFCKPPVVTQGSVVCVDRRVR